MRGHCPGRVIQPSVITPAIGGVVVRVSERGLMAVCKPCVGPSIRVIPSMIIVGQTKKCSMINRHGWRWDIKPC